MTALNMQTDIVVIRKDNGTYMLSCDNGAAHFSAHISLLVAQAIGVPQLPQRPGTLAPNPFNMQTDGATKVTAGTGIVTIHGPDQNGDDVVVNIFGDAYTELGGKAGNDAAAIAFNDANMQTDAVNGNGL
jgi:hypothetical protein